MRILKDSFEILCRNTAIPAKVPIVPNIKVKKNNVASGMRVLSFIARFLSIPKKINVTSVTKINQESNQ